MAKSFFAEIVLVINAVLLQLNVQTSQLRIQYVATLLARY
jgi:hypothetical protein